MGNQTMKNLIKPENEAEAIAIKSLLDEHGIYVEIKSFHDTAYDGLFQTQYGWGVIRVDESNFSKAKKIVDEWYQASPEVIPWEDKEITTESSIENPQKPNNNFFSYTKSFLIILSFILNIFLLCFYFGVFREPLGQYDVSKILDKKGKVIATYKYGKNSQFPYEGTAFSPSGEVLSKFFDSNENGRWERVVNYSKSKKTISVDDNKNDIYETSTEIFNNGISIKSHDKNEDGIFETSIITDQKNQIIATIIDKNHDTFDDEIHYINDNGDEEIIPITGYEKLTNRILN
jgi:hypothetical protein